MQSRLGKKKTKVVCLKFPFRDKFIGVLVTYVLALDIYVSSTPKPMSDTGIP